ncbi:hypothetical protein BP6252_06594 [Coleophoma cylindrospora]|uniref:Uncharacterized protein n=1 Tax=Coleophoma cylindrospora TaxID=1849047 RepID=A0A3D8RMX7_9HELO|nr:hypothetical protein BP6252_06594 [Coleophoma cylindrospora]
MPCHAHKRHPRERHACSEEEPNQPKRSLPTRVDALDHDTFRIYAAHLLDVQLPAPEANHRLEDQEERVHARHDADVDDLVTDGVFTPLATMRATRELAQLNALDDAHDDAAEPDDSVDELPVAEADDGVDEVQGGGEQEADEDEGEQADAELEDGEAHDFQHGHEQVGEDQDVVDGLGDFEPAASSGPGGAWPEVVDGGWVEVPAGGAGDHVADGEQDWDEQDG